MSDAPEGQHEIEQAEARLVIERLGANDDAVGFVARMNDGVFEAASLDARTFLLVRLAALAATGGGDTTWKLTTELLDAFDVDPKDALRTLVAIAPIIGTGRFMAAMEALGGE